MFFVIQIGKFKSTRADCGRSGLIEGGMDEKEVWRVPERNDGKAFWEMDVRVRECLDDDVGGFAEEDEDGTESAKLNNVPGWSKILFFAKAEDVANAVDFACDSSRLSFVTEEALALLPNSRIRGALRSNQSVSMVPAVHSGWSTMPARTERFVFTPLPMFSSRGTLRALAVASSKVRLRKIAFARSESKSVATSHSPSTTPL